jgi:hypothetical protein
MSTDHIKQFQFRPKPKPTDWSISLLCLFVLFELAQLMAFQLVLERAS